MNRARVQSELVVQAQTPSLAHGPDSESFVSFSLTGPLPTRLFRAEGSRPLSPEHFFAVRALHPCARVLAAKQCSRQLRPTDRAQSAPAQPVWSDA